MSDTKLTPMQIVKEQPTSEPATTVTLATQKPKKGRGLMPTRSAKFIVGMVLVLSIVLFAIIAPMFTQNPRSTDNAALQPPSAEHWLGTTKLGNDMLAQLAIGAQGSLLVGLVAGGIAIVLSLVIVTVLYVLVGLAAVAAMHWDKFAISGAEASLAEVLDVATGRSWPSMILALGAVIAIASVVLTVMYGQTRILFAMSRDGLVPDVFQKVSPGRRVPVANTVIVALFIGILAAAVPLGRLVDATSIGTLFAFALVSVGVIVLRRTRPDLPRSFRTPLFPVTPLLGVGFCVYLMVGLGGVTWTVFALWCAVGLAAYFLYGRRHSRLAAGPPRDPA